MTRDEAEAILLEAEPHNPGPWVEHSRNVAMCAEIIARAAGMDVNKAYIFGLLHDIGRRFGKEHMVHVYYGYRYMMEKGNSEIARICLTHAYNTKDIYDDVGAKDENAPIVQALLDQVEFDDYDRLIQLCDSIALAEGVVDIEYRMNDIKQRYGNYPQIKWNKNMEIKKYFEEKCGVEDIYDLLPEKTSIGGRNV